MASSDETFPAADANNELSPGNKTSVEVDPVSSNIAEKAEKKETGKGGAKEKHDQMQTLKKTMMISGAVIVVVGVAFAICKKARENKA